MRLLTFKTGYQRKYKLKKFTYMYKLNTRKPYTHAGSQYSLQRAILAKPLQELLFL